MALPENYVLLVALLIVIDLVKLMFNFLASFACNTFDLSIL